jgi:hypothetical protein
MQEDVPWEHGGRSSSCQKKEMQASISWDMRTTNFLLMIFMAHYSIPVSSFVHSSHLQHSALQPLAILRFCPSYTLTCCLLSSLATRVFHCTCYALYLLCLLLVLFLLQFLCPICSYVCVCVCLALHIHAHIFHLLYLHVQRF